MKLKKLLKGGIRTKFSVGLCIFSASDLHVKYTENLVQMADLTLGIGSWFLYTFQATGCVLRCEDREGIFSWSVICAKGAAYNIKGVLWAANASKSDVKCSGISCIFPHAFLLACLHVCYTCVWNDFRKLLTSSSHCSINPDMLPAVHCQQVS